MISFNVAKWGREERSICKKYLLSFGLLSDSKAFLKLKNLLKEQQRDSEIFLVNSARSGIEAALSWAISLQTDKKEVLVPDYICPSVVESVEKQGLKVVKVAVNEQLLITPEAVETLISENTLAIIVAHMYSAIADTRLISKLAADYGAIVIDDAAQRSGVKELDNLVGHDGDVGVVSFAQSKTIVTGVKGSGGIIFSKNKSFIEYYHKKYNKLDVVTRRWYPLLHFFFSYLKGGRWQMVDYYIQRVLQKLGINRNYYHAGKLSNLDASLAIAQYKTLDKRLAHVAENLSTYRKGFKQLTSVRAPQLLDDTLYLSRLIIQSTKIAPNELRFLLLKYGIASKYCYLDASRAYDGTNASGLLEIPLCGMSTQGVESTINALIAIEKGQV